MATAEQRAKVLSWKSSLAAPFGAPVYLRKKGFDKSGPLRREQGPETKWQKGRYVGLSITDILFTFQQTEKTRRSSFILSMCDPTWLNQVNQMWRCGPTTPSSLDAGS